MNKVYKVIWNAQMKIFIAVSELAKDNRGSFNISSESDANNNNHKIKFKFYFK
ncbi:TPA: ESPR domain-containing protein [Citrobacter freundii]|nr:ESPR domain-containing protein [Citrobacter freundii]